ncbi:hypothetical protein ACJ73_09562, partial [Blastomyces percursus]
MPTATTTTSSNPTPSALTSLTTLTTQNPTVSLTTQVLHNLQHQHLWTSLRIHDPRTLSPAQRMPLISGLPPQTLYTHPDEQAFMLEHGISTADLPVEREWVIPTAQGQAWSLRRLAECFDALPLPDSKHGDGGETVNGDGDGGGSGSTSETESGEKTGEKKKAKKMEGRKL